MIRPSKLLLGIVFALLLCGIIFSLGYASSNSAAQAAQMPTATLMEAITTQDMPVEIPSQSAPVATVEPAASTPYPQASTGSMPMGSGMNGTAGMNSTGTSCPMMGQMGSGMTGMNMSGTGMTGIGMSQGNVMTGTTMSGMAMNGMNIAATGMTGMTASNSLYDADGRFIFWNLNPWWLLGWVLMALVLIGILAAAVFGVVTLIRRSRRPVQV